MAALIVLAVLAVFVIIIAAKTVRIIPQARAGVVERLGRYSRTLNPGMTIIVPFIDRVKPLLDLREQVVPFQPQPVITQDNVTVHIDTVLYFTITDPKGVTYEVANPLQAIEQLTITTLRNVVGGLTLEQTLTSREEVNTQLRVVLDEATGKWGIRINRVEIKSIEPPASIQEAMEKQMRAERDRRAAILTAEGVKQSQILTAEGEKQSSVLRAEGAKTAAILRAEGESSAIATVFQAIHDGRPDQELLSYQYLQMLPQLAQGDANKIFIIPSEVTTALSNLANRLTRPMQIVSPEVEAYAEAHTTPPPAHLAGLAAETRSSLECPQMLTGEVEGRFLEMLVWTAQPSLVVELGTYSGFSALFMAGALAYGGRLITCELDPERAAFARGHIEATPYAARIEVREGPGLATLSAIDDPVDLAFIDADKDGYTDYYEALVPKLSERGLIVADNTLRGGGALQGDLMHDFNEHVLADERTACVLLPIRDGVTLIRLDP